MTRSMERRVNAAAFSVVLAAAAYVAFAMPAPVAHPRPVPEIDTAAARGLMDAGAVFIDVRPRDAFEAAHIPGAIAIPLAELASVLPTDPAIDRTQPIVVYGSVGASSAHAAVGVVREAGFTGAVSLRGGLASWRMAGLPVDPPADAGRLALN